MKLRHNTTGWTAPPKNDPEWEDRVTREAHDHTRKRKARVERARKRLDKAERAAKAAESERGARRRVKALWLLVEKRREELRELERQMTSVPAGSQNRGAGAHRGVPTGRSQI